jgi:hypothetical protein
MNFRIIVFILAFITLEFAAVAEVPNTLVVTSAAEPGVFTVFYKKPVTGKVKLSIFDKQNKLIFQEVLNHVGAFKRPYNFSNLAEGEYVFVLEDKNGKQEERINYQIRKVLTFVRVSAVVNEPNKYILNVVTNGKESVSIKIFDDLKGLVHEQSVEVNGSYGLIYNLNKAKSSSEANVTFEITSASGKVTTAKF